MSLHKERKKAIKANLNQGKACAEEGRFSLARSAVSKAESLLSSTEKDLDGCKEEIRNTYGSIGRELIKEGKRKLEKGDDLREIVRTTLQANDILKEKDIEKKSIQSYQKLEDGVWEGVYERKIEDCKNCMENEYFLFAESALLTVKKLSDELDRELPETYYSLKEEIEENVDIEELFHLEL